MNNAPGDPVFDQLAELAQNFPGHEYSGDLLAETRFFADLGFASIDAVVLGEMLETHFQRQFAFGTFLAAARDRGAEDITLGELSQFLHEQLAD